MEPYERKSTGTERDRWREVKFEHKKLVLEYSIVREYMKNYEICFEFGKAHGFNLPIPVTVMQQCHELSINLKRLDQWIRWAEDGTLGIRLTTDDIDLMAPPHTTAEQIMAYQDPTFAGWPAVIIAGVVIVSAVISYIALIKDELQEVQREYYELIGASQAKFCANPGSASCKAWLHHREVSGFSKNEGTIAKIKKGISGMFMAVGKGVSGALLIAIPLLMVWFLGKKDTGKKKRTR